MTEKRLQASLNRVVFGRLSERRGSYCLGTAERVAFGMVPKCDKQFGFNLRSDPQKRMLSTPFPDCRLCDPAAAVLWPVRSSERRQSRRAPAGKRSVA